MSETTRQKKFARAIQKELSEILQREIDGLDGTLVTVCHVYVTADFSIARVYLTCYPTAIQSVLVKYLNDETGKVRFKLAGRIRNIAKVTPELHFFEDDTLETANKIDELLNNALQNQSIQDEEVLKATYKNYDKGL